MSKVVAIIPARGGSKRIPGKNIINFQGKPMIAWTIEAAIKSNLFDKIIVSTDCAQIADISKKYGAFVPMLRAKANDDFSSVSLATIHTINQLKEIGYNYDIVVQLFAVCPLRNHIDIKNAMNFFLEKKASFLISCFKYVWMNPWWAAKLNSDNIPEKIFQKAELTRSQDLPELYCPTGAIWIANTYDLLKANTFYGDGHLFWEMDWKRSVDIDSNRDVELANILFNNEISK